MPRLWEERNIVLRNGTGKTVYGLRCKTSGHCFSENHGNHVFPIKNTSGGSPYVIIVSREGEVSAGLSRATEHDKNTIMRWVQTADEHCKEVKGFFMFRNI